jgi:PRTRC genetic system protein B
LGTGKLISADDIADIVKRSDANQRTGLLPKNTIAVGDNYYLFFRPSTYQTMWFRIAGSKSVRLTRRVPALVWKVSVDGSGASLFALKQNKFPESETRLYVPPFMNCSNQSICWGSARPSLKSEPLDTWPELLDDVFFNQSTFSHTGNSNTLIISGKRNNDDLDVFNWWKHQPERSNRFRSSALVPLNKKLKDIAK